MSKDDKRRLYNTLKEFNGQKYTGMKIGGKHRWNYRDGNWNETKISPEKWNFEFICNKYRTHQAPVGTGALNNTKYHWYIIADQKVTKLDANTYRTEMTGLKFKVAHKRPHWNHWSFHYKKETYEDRVINILEEVLETLKTKRNNRELRKFL